MPIYYWLLLVVGAAEKTFDLVGVLFRLKQHDMIDKTFNKTFVKLLDDILSFTSKESMALDSNNNNLVATNEQRIGRSLFLLNDGLRPFIEQVLRNMHGERWLVVAFEAIGWQLSPKNTSLETVDTHQLLNCLNRLWDSTFNPLQLKGGQGLYAWFAAEQSIGITTHHTEMYKHTFTHLHTPNISMLHSTYPPRKSSKSYL